MNASGACKTISPLCRKLITTHISAVSSFVGIAYTSDDSLPPQRNPEEIVAFCQDARGRLSSAKTLPSTPTRGFIGTNYVSEENLPRANPFSLDEEPMTTYTGGHNFEPAAVPLFAQSRERPQVTGSLPVFSAPPTPNKAEDMAVAFPDCNVLFRNEEEIETRIRPI